MFKSSWAAAGALALALALPATQAVAAPEEATLRAAFEQAVWPADIVRAADQYLLAFPDAESAAAVRAQRQRAAEAWRLVSRNEVRLYRSTFTGNPGTALPELRQAALGDREAVVRLAHESRRADEATGSQRFVGWLQYASLLGDEHASYELALHFRRTDQPLLAAHYEALALALGYAPAAALDHTRK